MVAVTFELGRATLVDSFSWWTAVVTLVGIRGVGLGAGWFILAGGVTGWIIWT
jgi:hypothetical protein